MSRLVQEAEGLGLLQRRGELPGKLIEMKVPWPHPSSDEEEQPPGYT